MFDEEYKFWSCYLNIPHMNQSSYSEILLNEVCFRCEVCLRRIRCTFKTLVTSLNNWKYRHYKSVTPLRPEFQNLLHVGVLDELIPTISDMTLELGSKQERLHPVPSLDPLLFPSTYRHSHITNTHTHSHVNLFRHVWLWFSCTRICAVRVWLWYGSIHQVSRVIFYDRSCHIRMWGRYERPTYQSLRFVPFFFFQWNGNG